EVAAFVEQRHQTLTVDAPTDLGTLAVEEDKLRDSVFQLLINAVKFTPDGGTVRLSGRRPPGGGGGIQGADTGGGEDAATPGGGGREGRGRPGGGVRPVLHALRRVAALLGGVRVRPPRAGAGAGRGQGVRRDARRARQGRERGRQGLDVHDHAAAAGRSGLRD